MPRNVRNYWVVLEIDGRKTRIATGPRRRTGGFTCQIYMRNRGEVDAQPLVIQGHVNGDKLTLKFFDARGDLTYSRSTHA